MHVTDAELISVLSPQLQGEPLQGAVYARLTTPLGFTRWLFGVLGNYLVARPAARSKAHEISQKTDVPLDAAVVLGVTSTSLHIWSADPLLSQVHDYLGEVPLSRFTAIQAGTAKAWQPMTFTLDDGHSFSVEARGNLHPFLSAFEASQRTETQN